MKKILTLILSIFILFGCTSNTSNPNVHAYKFTFEQHEYIMFYETPGHATGVVMDPNCWCMIDYD